MTENISIQDVIQRKPELIASLDSVIYEKYFFNKNYYAIIEILKSGPKTVKEIHDLYPAKKAKNTIYRYIKEDLVTAGIVIEAGRRLQSDRTSTEILYSLSSRLLLIEDMKLHVFIDNIDLMGEL